MIQITDKTKCCGCTACYSACPQKCIAMTADYEGFLYPVVDKEHCINCGICEKVCPVTHPPIVSDNPRRTFAARSTDHNNLLKSTSGGMFFPLLSWTYRKKGIMCAAGYGKNFEVEHMLLDLQNHKLDEEDLWGKFRGSKYVQSTLNEVFIRLQQYLEQGRTVCFIGTPCQVNGLVSFLGREYRNLLTVDLVCHGTPSPKLWNKYLNYQKQKYRSEIAGITFRSKIYGYHSGGRMQIAFENGKQYCASARTDFMLKSFFAGIASRPSCYVCPFKKLERCSDLTLYDCWRYPELTGQKDDDKGYTNVIVHSDKGSEVLASLNEQLQLTEVDSEKAVKLCGVMVRNSAKKHPMRDAFYDDMDRDDLVGHVKKFIPVVFVDLAKERIIQILYCLGILKLIKRNKKGC